MLGRPPHCHRRSNHRPMILLVLGGEGRDEGGRGLRASPILRATHHCSLATHHFPCPDSARTQPGLRNCRGSAPSARRSFLARHSFNGGGSEGGAPGAAADASSAAASAPARAVRRRLSAFCFRNFCFGLSAHVKDPPAGLPPLPSALAFPISRFPDFRFSAVRRPLPGCPAKMYNLLSFSRPSTPAVRL